MASNVLFLAAFQFRLDRFLEPTRILSSGATSAELLRRAAVLDLFGYYLIAGLSLVRDVLLGVLFVLWTAWWISLLVIFARQKQTTSTTSPS